MLGYYKTYKKRHPEEIDGKSITRIFTAFILTLTFPYLSLALAAEAPATVGIGKTKLGDVWVDSKGMTLYTFDKDKPGQSVCFGKCVKNWPLLLAPDGAKPVGDWTIIKRRDGQRQWAYKGQAIYSFIDDKKSGEVKGDAVRDIWHLAKP